MERSCLTVTNLLITTTLFFGMEVSLTPRLALGAGILLSKPAVVETRESKETFAESRFGSPPSRLDSEGKSRLVMNEMETLRQSEAEGSFISGEGFVSNRKPAGLEFTKDTGRVGGVQAYPQPERSTARTGIQEVAIIAGDLGFFPKTVFVTRDIPVRLYVTGASKKTLCIMMDLEGLQMRKQIRSQKIEELTFTPTRAGQFRFYCPINGLEGTLLVKDGSYSSGRNASLSAASTTITSPTINGVE